MHCLITGVSLSGKSSLAKMLARKLSKDRTILVYDPLGLKSDWPTDKVTRDPAELQEWMLKFHKCHVFIDEAGELFDNGVSREDWWITTQSRHLGHSVNLIAQRAIQIPVTVRDQCTRCYTFQVSKRDADTLAAEFNKPELQSAVTLKQLEFYVMDRFGLFAKLRVDHKKGDVCSTVAKSLHKRVK